jgi:hypothetical protein
MKQKAAHGGFLFCNMAGEKFIPRAKRLGKPNWAHLRRITDQASTATFERRWFCYFGERKELALLSDLK